MKYSDFVEKTKNMNNGDRGKFFAELDEDEQTELMDDYYTDAKPEEMLLQVRIIGASEMIYEEQQKEKKDEKKLENWLKLYNQLCTELANMK